MWQTRSGKERARQAPPSAHAGRQRLAIGGARQYVQRRQQRSRRGDESLLEGHGARSRRGSRGYDRPLYLKCSSIRSNAIVNGVCIIGSVISMPIKPTETVIGKPTANTLICCATRETMPSTRLTNSSIATIGKAIHRP